MHTLDVRTPRVIGSPIRMFWLVPPWLVGVCLSLVAISQVSPSPAQETVPIPVADGSVLPFPPPPTSSLAGETIQTSRMKWRTPPRRLAPDAPNVLIILLDDIGYGQADTFGGECHTPTLSRLWREGIADNAFHTTSICSPTRAALLTGRSPHRVGHGILAEPASDLDGPGANMPIFEQVFVRSEGHLSAGRHRLEIVETISRPGAAAEVALTIDGKPAGRGTVPRTVPGAFTASETFDVGVDLGSPVGESYHDRGPFRLQGRVDSLRVELR